MSSESNATSPLHLHWRLWSIRGPKGWSTHSDVLKNLGILTKGDWQTLELAAQGGDSFALAAISGRSRHTIRHQLHNIHQKLRAIGAIRDGGNPRILMLRWYLEYRQLGYPSPAYSRKLARKYSRALRKRG